MAKYLVTMDKSEFKKYFSFCFVRNPWDRTLSAYRYLAKGGITHWDRKFRDEELSKITDFEDFVLNWMSQRSIAESLHFRAQTSWICHPGSGLEMKFIGRFEDLTNDFARLCDVLDLDSSLLAENLNRSGPVDYREFYSDRMKNKIHSLYRSDIEYLDYAF
jgi:hypothetical protein